MSSGGFSGGGGGGVGLLQAPWVYPRPLGRPPMQFPILFRILF